MEEQREIVVGIDSVAYGAMGIGKHGGQIIFVPGALPGDKVNVCIEADKGRFAHAKLLNYIERSSLTQASPCAYHSCGGCQWLHAPAKNQREWKRQFVADAFTRIAKMTPPKDFQLLASPQQLGYRNRVLLRGTIDADGKVGVGFFKKATKEQVHVDTCMIARPALNQVIKKIAEMQVAVKPQKFRIELQEFEAFSQQQAHITAVIHPVVKNDFTLDALAAKVRSLPEVIWAGLTRELQKPPFLALEVHNKLTYFSSPGQFFQVNLAHNRQLRTRVEAAVAAEAKPKKVLDLFSGSGNLSLGLAKAGNAVTGVEANPVAINAANYAARFNQLKNCKYIVGDALKYLKKSVRKRERFDLVLLDPPRAGMKEGMGLLSELGPETVIYVSCDPSTLARDVLALDAAYSLESLTCFDFFPNTFHVESLAILKRRI